VKVSDAVKRALPDAAPKPGAFKKPGTEAVVAQDAPAAETNANEGGEA
jgi:hypothetical protein